MTAGQRWTTERPKEPGWYWWRNHGDKGEIVHVVAPDVVLLCGDMGIFSVRTMIGDGTGEWQGPITSNDQEAG